MFFRAGVLGQMEEFRDERLSKILSWMQAFMRGYLARKDYAKLQEQRLALQIVQRNLRRYLQLRTWPWWKLWQKVRPLLNATRIEDELAVSISNIYLYISVGAFKLLYFTIYKFKVAILCNSIMLYIDINVTWVYYLADIQRRYSLERTDVLD